MLRADHGPCGGTRRRGTWLRRRALGPTVIAHAGHGRGVNARIGTAGWSIPSRYAETIAGPGTHLQRYAGAFEAVEINSSFHRPHRRTTYERWAAAVPPGFRFAVKLPRAITHERRLAECDDLIARFAEETDGLGGKRGPVLVQLPPSLAFAAAEAERFFVILAALIPGAIVCEPRHASWFAPEADGFLMRMRVARVATDPMPAPGAGTPGGWPGLAYFRMHGTPQIYRSDYGDRVQDHARWVRALAATGTETWFIYDNTASGAATGDALRLACLLRGGACEARSQEGECGSP